MTRKSVSIAFDLAWYSVIAVIAFFAVCVELDRQGRFDLRTAKMVPDLIKGDALENLAKVAFERNESVQGQDLARKLVERRPIPAESLSLYAGGLLMNGEEEAGLAALQIAAGRGWRDRFVQRVVVLSALNHDTPEIAANRVVALWRIGERADWLKGLTRATLEEPGGLSAFESTLIEDDRYLDTDFLGWAATSLPERTVNRLARRIAANRSKFDCSKFSVQAYGLVRSGRGSSASNVWDALCSSRRRSSLNNIAFAPMSVLPGPFDWRYPENAGVDVDIRQEREDAVLHYSSSDPLSQVIARRYLTLAPDSYIARVGRVAKHSDAKWRIVCITAGGPKPEVKLDAVIDGQRSFAIPTTCPVQELSIVVQAGAGDIGMIHLSRFEE
ncbi:hypothetical protein QUC32_24555 [Novosphingobium resinovorum]|uniref:hypothetical protein n=1 Tax=Novosphingobium TaxID=165696 RepID=UPI001B3C8771|nr:MULTISPECIES: hypothetical protein [Novosphingobium]MBF7012801.1 hypothetical protein [Novosphingobium sp. HR1a]WJM27538.1 hypothetical protein QUC32_24555 [Novosphingobium resinovorum]